MTDITVYQPPPPTHPARELAAALLSRPAMWAVAVTLLAFGLRVVATPGPVTSTAANPSTSHTSASHAPEEESSRQDAKFAKLKKPSWLGELCAWA